LNDVSPISSDHALPAPGTTAATCGGFDPIFVELLQGQMDSHPAGRTTKPSAKTPNLPASTRTIAAAKPPSPDTISHGSQQKQGQAVRPASSPEVKVADSTGTLGVQPLQSQSRDAAELAAPGRDGFQLLSADRSGAQSCSDDRSSAPPVDASCKAVAQPAVTGSQSTGELRRAELATEGDRGAAVELQPRELQSNRENEEYRAPVTPDPPRVEGGPEPSPVAASGQPEAAQPPPSDPSSFTKAASLQGWPLGGVDGLQSRIDSADDQAVAPPAAAPANAPAQSATYGADRADASITEAAPVSAAAQTSVAQQFIAMQPAATTSAATADSPGSSRPTGAGSSRPSASAGGPALRPKQDEATAAGVRKAVQPGKPEAEASATAEDQSISSSGQEAGNPSGGQSVYSAFADQSGQMVSSRPLPGGDAADGERRSGLPGQVDDTSTQLPEAYQSSQVQSARVLERITQSEVHVALNTSTFGSIDLRTTISQDRIGATITTGHAGLQAAMLAEVPSLQHAMEGRELRLESINVNVQADAHSRREGQHQDSPPAKPTLLENEPRETPAEQQNVRSDPALSYSTSGINIHA